MPDRTASYCERCGTRYVFCVDADKGEPLRKVRLLAKGLRDLLLPDDDPNSGAPEPSRADNDRARLDEAFHRTFNFCLTCRMYACDKCWNPSQGACLTCAPQPDDTPVAPQDHLIVRTPATRPDQGADRGDGQWLFPDILGPAAGATPLAAVVSSSVPAIDLAAQSRETARPAAPAWPTRDLETAAGGPGAVGPVACLEAPADHDWPAADLATPGSDLTADEMLAVRSQLDRKAEPAALPLPTEASVPDLVEVPLPAAVELPAAAEASMPRILPLPEPPIPAASLAQAVPGAPAESGIETLEAFLLRASMVGGAAEPAVEPLVEPAPSAAEVAVPEQPQPVAIVDATPPAPVAPVARTIAPPWAQPAAPKAPTTPPPTLETPAAETPRAARRPAMARLLSRVAALSGAGHSRPATPEGDPWPHATAWSERPVRPQNWAVATEDEAASDPAGPEAAFLAPVIDVEAVPAALPVAESATPPQPGPEPVVGLAAATPATPEPTAAPWTAAPGFEFEPEAGPIAPTLDIDLGPARGASVAPVEVATTAEPVAADAAPIDLASGPEPVLVAPGADREPIAPAPAEPVRPAARPLRRSIFDIPTATDEARPEGKPASVPWPPLGARWPARETPGTPWPAPAIRSVAAREDAASLVTQMWVDSADEVLNRGTVRVCHHCTLPVSTQARFCRRCGTRQA